MNDAADLLVFDLDGTLVDSAEDLRVAMNLVLAEQNRRSLSRGEVIAMIGDGAPALIQRAFAHTGSAVPETALPALRRSFLDHYAAADDAHSRPYPGVEETLERLATAGFRFAVCTNKPEGPANRVLAKMGLRTWFEVVVGGDSVGVRKPDPAHVRAVLAQVDGGRARTAVMIGDSAHDINAAQGAGLSAVAVSYGYGAPGFADGLADLVIDRFGALPQALTRLAQRLDSSKATSL